MDGVLTFLWNLWTDICQAFADLADAVFPTSPFRGFIDQLDFDSMFLSWLNWFMPIPEICSVLTLWGSMILLYYGWMAIWRAIKWVDG